MFGVFHKNIMCYNTIISNEKTNIKGGVRQKKKFNKNQHMERENWLNHPISTVQMCAIKKNYHSSNENN